MRARTCSLLACLLVGASSTALAEDGFDAKAQYTKHEARIPMRDGVKLYTTIYTPKDTSRRYPILLTRTPYGLRPYGVDNHAGEPEGKLARAGYIFVFQDVRGRNMSEGQFVDLRPFRRGGKSGEGRRGAPKGIDEATDTHDTIAWLLRTVSNHNGKVGMMGVSYPGFYAVAALVDPHPALAAVSPQAPIGDWFLGDDFHQNGALLLTPAFNFLGFFGQPRPQPTRKRARPYEHDDTDGYLFFLQLGPLSNVDAQHFKGRIGFWKDLMAHGTYDAFWQARSALPHLRKVRPSVLTVGGWFDGEDLYGTLKVHQALVRGGARDARLVMGPWSHGSWTRTTGERLGAVSFATRTSDFYSDRVELPFFEHHLKGKGKPGLAAATVFETGTNQWRSYDAWPPREAKPARLCFAAGGRLLLSDAAAGRSARRPPAPLGAPPGDAAGHDEYVSDPARPVPYIPGTAIEMPIEYMVEDQRFASRRPDVLVYQTEPLDEDLTIAGPLRPELHVSTSGTDSDWVVKLIDVYPDDFPNSSPNRCGARMGGYQQLVRGTVMRGRFRDSFERPQPFVPGRPTRVAFGMPDINHTFRRGHRVMIQVQSSWFPLVDRNPQTFVDIAHAKPSDFRRAVQRVHRSSALPSCLGFGRLPLRI
jgi:uncharacterized protein